MGRTAAAKPKQSASRVGSRSTKRTTGTKTSASSARSAGRSRSAASKARSTTQKTRPAAAASRKRSSAKRTSPRPATRRTGTRGAGARRTGTNNGSTIRTYRSALRYLRGLTNFEENPRYRYDAKRFNLDRMKKILAALDQPQRQMRVVHIAGTKGKGSTATMVACMLQGCGYKVGLYTSPHLLSVCERMSINGTRPTEQAFTRTLSRVVHAARKAYTKTNPPTYFEIITAVAFCWFADQQADVAVIEAGMGGRLDSTNVVKPEVCGITSISRDHTDHLGGSLSSIAAEKAGIIKRGVPVVSAPQKPEVTEVLTEAAQKLDAPLLFPGENSQFSYRFESSRELGPHTRLSLTTPRSKFEHLHVPLPGEHQAINCSVALSMMDALKTRGFDIDDQRAIEGLANVRMSGRMEMVNDEPRVLVDGAHNASSVEALMRAIGQNVPYDSMIVIFACNKDKDISGMLRHIQLGADKVIFTTANTPKSAEPEDLLARFQEKCGKMAQAASSLREAMEIATSAITREDLVCITGSFHIVTVAKRYFDKLEVA